ncbi:MAG TPA: hypothetical protein VN541_02385, partial [Tepidisphaeraceae bacterium]|nr:hypothetical protein [Tepidisphaeraceae bacterium]
LVTPHAHDQPDNAWRLMKLGVARQISPRRYRASRAASVLSELIGSQHVRQSCADVRKRFDRSGAVGHTCELFDAFFAARDSTRQTAVDSRNDVFRVKGRSCSCDG